MSNFAPTRTTYGSGDRRWLRDMLKAETHDVSVTPADVSDDANGLVLSGSVVAGEGLVLDDFTILTGETHLISVVHAGTVDRRYLPAQLDQAGEASFPAITFINGTAPAA